MSEQRGFFDDMPEPPPKAKEPPYEWGCVECDKETPHMVNGVRYCFAHHPDPGDHIKR
jgi:hypothetical protein